MGKHPDQEPNMMIHELFHGILFRPSSRGTTGPKGEKLTEYHDVLLRMLPILKRHSGYRLYVTGHSLGGALATIFSVVASAELDSIIPKPVTCVSFGSPFLGDQSFQDCHRMLEAEGKLRNLRITNHQDLVPTYPKISTNKTDTLYNLWFDEGTGVGTMFKHVGMNIRLYGGGRPFRVLYPKVGSNYADEIERGWASSFFSNVSFSSTDYCQYHSIAKYNKRLTTAEDVLEFVNLNELYRDRNTVGDLDARIWY